MHILPEMCGEYPPGDPLVDGVGEPITLVEQDVQMIGIELVAFVDLAASNFGIAAQHPQHATDAIVFCEVGGVALDVV